MTDMTLGAYLKALRLLGNPSLTLEQAASAMNMTWEALQELETDRRRADPAELNKIVQVLNADIALLGALWEAWTPAPDPETTIPCRTCAGTGRVPENAYDRCDTAIMHGPGHQSISPCEVEGPHTEHSCYGYEWTDKDIGTQTAPVSHYRDGFVKETLTYRLASAN